MDYTPLRMDRTLPPLSVNLYSDTQTRPTPAMKAAMMEAEVGDEQFGWDPTATALQERMAALMGKEAALFLPSGTMCNQIAIATHCRPGDEIVVSSERGAHFMLFGGAAMGSKRYIWWNFVSSSKERIEQAKQEWKTGKFDIVPGDEEEFIPLPEP